MSQCYWVLDLVTQTRGLQNSPRSLPPLSLPSEMIVFKPGDLIYHSKILSFYRTEPFDLVACYADPKALPCPEEHIGEFSKHIKWFLFLCCYFFPPHVGSFRIKDVVPNEEGEAAKVKVKVRLNIHGVFFVKSATLVEKIKPEEEQEMEVEAPPPPSTPATTATPPSNETAATGSSETADGPAEGEVPPMEADNEQTPPSASEDDSQPSGDQGSAPEEGAGPNKEATPNENNGSDETPKTDDKKSVSGRFSLCPE